MHMPLVFRRALSQIAALAVLAATVFAAGAATPDDVLQRAKPRARIVATIDDEARVTRGGNRHPAAINANEIGPADDAFRLDRMILLLKPDAAQVAALDDFITLTHDHASPHFGRWLDEARFEQHFGVAQSDIAQVTRWLSGHGFTVEEIPRGGRSIIFSGTVAQVRRAFRTDIRRYRVDNEDHIANASEPQIPAALANVIDGVVSLHDFHSRPLHGRSPVAPEFTSGSTHYLAATDFHNIYNLKPLYAQGINGNGKSIAILGRTQVNTADMQQFRSFMGLVANPPQIIVNGTNPGYVSGDHGESDLDLEWAGAIAPAATIKFVTSKSTGSSDGIALSATYAVSNNVADVISVSYGLCEQSMSSTQRNFFNTTWQQAAALGITVVVSSGDNGAAGCDSASQTTATHARGVNGICSPPYSTCVGGTQFADTTNPSLYWSATNNPVDQSSALSYIPEVVWNESGSNGGSGLWSSGGGVSGSASFTGYAKPSWQTTPGVPAGTKRFVPDVSMTAAVHDGYLVYSSDNATLTQNLYVFGGTSASAPSFAGIMALVNQKTGYRIGNANPTLYGLATRQATNGSPLYFHTITSGNNSVPGLTGFSASAATPYYNEATGLGSVDANVLVSRWTDLLPATTTTLVANPNPSVSGQNVTFTATVSGATPTGTVQFADGAANLGAAVTLVNGVATLTTGALTAGTHGVTASYSGNTANQPGTSATLQQTVLVNTSVTLSSPNSSAAIGAVLTFTATVTGLVPSGTVQFKDGGVNLGAPVTVTGGTAILSISTLSIGSHNISASYSGDAANAASTSATLVQTVVPATSSIIVGSNLPSATVGQNVTFTATISGYAPTGSVQFMDGGTNLGAALAVNGGIAILNVSTLSVGNHNITANYSGDTANAASTSGVLVETVVSAASSVGLVSSALSITDTQSVTFTATVSGFAPTGTIQFADGGVNLGAAVALSGGIATLTTASLGVGSHSITANYSGDVNNLGSVSAAIAQTVTAASGGGPAVPALPGWALSLLVGSMLVFIARARSRRS